MEESLYTRIDTLTMDAAYGLVTAAWNDGNERGDGYAVEQADLDTYQYLYSVGTGDRAIALYRTGTELIGVGDANGLWAVTLASA